ncbi:MAG: hypothetical protein FWG92_06955 [Leptospirales bacterium]|nr:hypothetical protein [Leptospirales bacterium]
MGSAIDVKGREGSAALFFGLFLVSCRETVFPVSEWESGLHGSVKLSITVCTTEINTFLQKGDRGSTPV